MSRAISPTTSSAPSPALSKIEAVLRLVSTQAVDPSLSLSDALSLYRSVATLARALRTERADNGLPRGFAPDLLVMLIGVLNAICGRALDPAATPSVTASLSRAIGQLTTACHRARATVEKPPKLAPASAPAPVPVKKPVPVQAVRPVPVKPVAPQDRALMDRLMADTSRRSILDYRHAA